MTNVDPNAIPDPNLLQAEAAQCTAAAMQHNAMATVYRMAAESIEQLRATRVMEHVDKGFWKGGDAPGFHLGVYLALSDLAKAYGELIDLANESTAAAAYFQGSADQLNADATAATEQILAMVPPGAGGPP